MKWRSDPFWTDALKAAMELSVGHTLVLTPDEFVSSRDVFYPVGQARRFDLLTLRKVSAFVIQKDQSHLEALPPKLLRDDFARRFHCVFANEVFVIYSALEEALTLTEEMERHIPAFLEQRERCLAGYGDDDDGAPEQLPHALDIQGNRVCKTLFQNHHYVLEQFRDLSGEPSIIRREVFRYCVSEVHFELSAFCNRSCSYCPVSLLDRKNKGSNMSWEIFRRCIDDLAEIDYDKEIGFCIFNEPLYDRDYLLKALDYADRMLPKCFIKLVSNGDYLTEEYFRELTGHRIDEFTISVHYDGTWDRDRQWDRIRKILERIGLSEKGDLEEDGGRMIYFVDPAAYDSRLLRSFELRSEDFTVHGVDRAGTLQSGIRRVSNLDHCVAVMSQLNIAYDGTVVPCCSMCSDVPEIKKWTYGKVQEYGDLFSAYTCAKAAAFRRMLFAPRHEGEYTPEPCRMCSVAEYDGEAKLYRLDDPARREIYDCWLKDKK